MVGQVERAVAAMVLHIQLVAEFSFVHLRHAREPGLLPRFGQLREGLAAGRAECLLDFPGFLCKPNRSSFSNFCVKRQEGMDAPIF